MRKLIALAITSGLAKKAWDAWRGTTARRPTAAPGQWGRESSRHARREGDRRNAPRGGAERRDRAPQA